MAQNGCTAPPNAMGRQRACWFAIAAIVAGCHAKSVSQDSASSTPARLSSTPPLASVDGGATDSEAIVVDPFTYANDAEVAAVWKPGNRESAPPTMTTSLEARSVGRFDCPFATLSDWRVSWDRDLKLDLSGVDRVRLRVRAANPDAVGSIMIYFRSGAGWYRMPSAVALGDWKTVELDLRRARSEGKPNGFHAIDAMRLSVLPRADLNTHVEVAWIDTKRGWSVEEIGRFGSLGSTRVALEELARRAKGRATEKDVRRRLDEASALVTEFSASADRMDSQARAKAERARRLLAEAYALIQDPKSGELRAFWGHFGDGIGGAPGNRKLTWAEVIPTLADSGFNAIFPNFLWSGVAFYPSKVVPRAPVVEQKGDLLKQAIVAARKRGMQIHVWKVSWQFAEGWLAPDGVSKPFADQKRLQVDAKGEIKPWLCPAHPKNRKYEMDAFLEAANYDIDGLHLDYIRYAGRDVCFCDSCRQLFPEQTGRTVERWPEDVARGGALEEAYAEWRRERITSFVRELRQALRKKKPKLKLSAAVFPRPRDARYTVLQDWPRWVEEGLLDFVCTMTYTEDVDDLRHQVADQLKIIDGRVPLYVGLYAAYKPEQTQALEVQVEQILATRELGAAGFVLFELQEHLLADLLPYLRAGLTRPMPAAR